MKLGRAIEIAEKVGDTIDEVKKKASIDGEMELLGRLAGPAILMEELLKILLTERKERNSRTMDSKDRKRLIQMEQRIELMQQQMKGRSK